MSSIVSTSGDSLSHGVGGQVVSPNPVCGQG